MIFIAETQKARWIWMSTFVARVFAILLMVVGIVGILAPIIVHGQQQRTIRGMPQTTPRSQRSEVDRDLDRLEEQVSILKDNNLDYAVRLKLIESRIQDIKTSLDDAAWWQKAMAALGGSSSVLCAGVALNLRRRKKDEGED